MRTPRQALAAARLAAARLLGAAARRLEPRPTRVLLIDLENFGVQPNTRPIRVLRILDAIIATAGPVDEALLAAPGQFETLRPLVESRGIRLHTCPRGKDAADQCLLDLAQARPHARLIVASGDHAFAPLAAAGRVSHVIALSQCYVSRLLAGLAPSISYLNTAAA